MNVHQLLSALIFLEYVDAWMSTHLHTRAIMAPPLHAQQAGSFFNPVPDNNNDDKDDSTKNEADETNGEINNSSSISPEANDNSPSNDLSEDDPFQASLAEMIRQRKQPSLASQPSTINGKPTAGQGFGTQSSSKSKKTNSPNSPSSSSSSKPFVGIGPRSLNDPTKPEYDDQGYTLYANEETGEKSRVFEALVEYPCDFTLKIVGANEGMFVQEMVAVVAESCQVSVDRVPHSTRTMGKWMSVTVHAPVQSAEMLYQLYENVGTWFWYRRILLVSNAVEVLAE